MGAGRIFLACLCSIFAAPLVAETGEQVVVVYNSRVPASKKVAEHYASKRNVPTNQVISFFLPETETISRDEFERDLQQPLWNELVQRKLFTLREKPRDGSATQQCNVIDAKIRYVLLCYGVPVKITADADRKEAHAEKLPVELRRNEAAVDSELTLLPLFDQRLPISGSFVNPSLNATNRVWLHPTNGVLMVTRLDGPTPDIAMGLVDKALEAEENGLVGNVYVDSRGTTDPTLKQADEMMKATAELARLYGFDVVKDESSRTFAASTPLSDIAFYVGWYDQSVSGPFTNGMAAFRPGAFAYHLHSFSARHLRTATTWWAGPLLAAGATATMGFTEEPYLQSTPLMNSFFYRFVHLDFTYGEAAFASQPWLSWQVTVIGDPLYRPFAKHQKERFEQLARSKHANLEWSVLMWVNFLVARNSSLDEVEKFYQETTPILDTALMQEKLGDVYKSKGKLIDASAAYSKALAGKFTPLQRLRLILKAAPLFSGTGKIEQAYDLYKEVLKDHPSYSDKKHIYEKLTEIALRLKKNDEAAEYQRLARETPRA
ncbi:MAG TPA: TIGR03790 family protein [Verrucomicrobiae bacterium]